MMQNFIKHSQLTLIANLGLTTYWSQFDAMPASITSDREPREGLS
jgi:hypothetical protein